MQKLLVLLALVVIVIPTIVCSQVWQTHSLFEPTTTMRSLAMRYVDVGIAVGDSGVFRRTQSYTLDAELRRMLWTTEHVNKTVMFKDVALLGAGGFIAVGENGNVWRAESDDGALTQLEVTTSQDLMCVVVHNDVVTICGSNGTVLRSTDNGTSFVSVDIATTKDVIDICVDEFGHYAAITTGDVLYSLDGLNWEVTATLTNTFSLQCIQAVKRPVFEDWMLLRLGNPWVFEGSTDGGETWVNLFPEATALRNTHPMAKALSMSVSDDLSQNNIMFFDVTTSTPFHFASFDFGSSWQELCTMFFTEFVGTSLDMVDDSTMISTGTNGAMLTFNRRGVGVQQFWSAPESLGIPFEPESATLGSLGALVSGLGSVVECSPDFSTTKYIFHNQFEVVREIESNAKVDAVLVDSLWYDLSGPTPTDKYLSHLYVRGVGSNVWTKHARSQDTMHTYGLSLNDTSIVVIEAGKTTRWYDSYSQPARTQLYADTSWVNMFGGLLIDRLTAWTEVITLDAVTAPIGVITTDGGVTWNKTSPPPFFARHSVLATDGTMIMIGAEYGSISETKVQVAISTDNGNSWDVTFDHQTNELAFVLAPIHHLNGITIFVEPRNAYVSYNSGRTWESLKNIPLEGDDFLAAGHLTSDTTVALFTRSGLVFTAEIEPNPTSVNEGKSTTRADNVNRVLVGNTLLVDAQITNARAYDALGKCVALEFKTSTQSSVEMKTLPSGYWFVVLDVIGTESENLIVPIMLGITIPQ